ncbi:InlB B-repeat-containing protein [Butyrivibrio sp. MC2021]|uniref:InlB B-repeat-containing protein n=1 Tax=Butyrivibrio sp. MC2021 TaxID=1408306 RepID=UPI00047A573B|nr:InlB B-repeat-containing protein [Butyrivibrio sp. MC2021]
MKKKLLGRLLSLTLSASLAVTGFSTPVFAAEIGESLEEADTEAAELFEEEELTCEDEISEGEASSEESDFEEPDLEEPDSEEPDSEEESEEVLVEEEELICEEPADEEETFEEEAAEEAAEETASEEAQGIYYLKFNAGIPEGCLQKELLGYDDGQTVPTEIGEPIVLSGDEFELPGYNLTGWTYIDAKGKKVKVSKPYATIKSLTETPGETFEFTPVWKLGTYTITYDFNGGIYSGKNKFTYKLDSKTVNKQPLLNYVSDGEGFAINTKNPEVVRAGYVFEGWECGSREERCYGGNIFRNMTLKAKWAADTCTVRLDANGGTVYGSVVYNFKTTTDYSFSDWTAERKGYTHKGWMAKVKGKDKTFKLTDTINLRDLDRGEKGVYTITAVWEVNKYSISYDVGEGKIAKAPRFFKTGDGTAIPTPTRPGYKFGGWQVKLHESDEDEGTLVDAKVAGYISDGKLTSIVTDNLTLYASWEVLNYNITFRNADGSYLMGDNGEMVTVDSFNGIWYTDEKDFAIAASIIEESGALGSDVSIAGFAKTENARKPVYNLNVKYSKFLPATYEGEGTEVPVTLYVVPQEKVYRITYQTRGADVKGGVYSFTTGTITKELPIKATAVRKGFVFKGWTVSGEFDRYVIKDSDGYVKAIKAGTDKSIVLVAEYGDVNTYTVTLMPAANDVYDAKGVAIDPKAGVPFIELDSDRFSFDATTYPLHQLITAGEGWKREGYTFGGFYSDPKYKNYAFFAEGLGSGRDSDVKVYARWYPTTHKVDFSTSAYIQRGNKTVKMSQGSLKTTFSGREIVEYGTRDITPKAVKATGYTFLGWKVEGKLSDDSGVVYTDSSKNYVKMIKKTNKVNITLAPVLKEITYKVYVNTNGGSYKDSTGKILVADLVYYSDTLKDVYKNIASGVKKSGYSFGCVSSTKDSKGNIRRGDDIYGYGYGKKQDASVVLNVIWNPVNPSVPTLPKSKIRINGDTLSLASNDSPSLGYSRLVFEYSTDAAFKTDVKSYTWVSVSKDIYGNMIYPSVKITSGRNYYVRVRKEIVDSTGEYFPGKWSSTVMATK